MQFSRNDSPCLVVSPPAHLSHLSTLIETVKLLKVVLLIAIFLSHPEKSRCTPVFSNPQELAPDKIYNACGLFKKSSKHEVALFL